jgi:hypothetical protein
MPAEEPTLFVTIVGHKTWSGQTGLMNDSSHECLVVALLLLEKNEQVCWSSVQRHNFCWQLEGTK